MTIESTNRVYRNDFYGTFTFDDRDAAIVAEREAELNKREGFRLGDWVRFADDRLRRISHIWPDGVQTSDGGSYYLGNGYVSMSGSLYRTVPNESLTLTDETRPGWVWIFHHDMHVAHNGVDVQIPFRVYTCNLPAPTS
jgi:hypothetical protein